MGVSTDGQLCWGIVFEEGTEFPWDADEFEDGIYSWWRSVNGYVNPKFNPYDEAGEYKPGVTKGDPRITEWRDHQTEWDCENPVPVELVNYQSADYPAYIVAVAGKAKSASRGSPEIVDPGTLTIRELERATLLSFVKQYIGPEHGEPAWWLSSFWG